jgi:hypothetical protein
MRECICRTRITYIHIFIFPVSTGGTGGATATRHPLIPKVACAVRPRNRAQCARCIRCAAHAVRGVGAAGVGVVCVDWTRCARALSGAFAVRARSACVTRVVPCGVRRVEACRAEAVFDSLAHES